MIGRLRCDLGANLAGIAVILDLLDRLMPHYTSLIVGGGMTGDAAINGLTGKALALQRHE